MSDEESTRAAEAEARAKASEAREPEVAEEELDEDDDASSPFDHPAFLPVLLWALAIWFGYDGWINQDPDMLEHVTFNRVGFGVLVLAGTYYTVQALRERRGDGNESEQNTSPGD